jgi:hypothetical protein
MHPMPVSTLESIGPIHLAGQERQDVIEIQRSISIKIKIDFRMVPTLAVAAPPQATGKSYNYAAAGELTLFMPTRYAVLTVVGKTNPS